MVGLKAAVDEMPGDQISGIATWLGHIGSDLCALSSLRKMAEYAAVEIVEGQGSDPLGIRVLRAAATRFGGYKEENSWKG